MIYEVIKNFNKQLGYKPEIKNPAVFHKQSRFVVVGMGGSHLAADLIKSWNPNIDLIIHRDYGLPDLPGKDLKRRLVILSSYSGNTEEVISAFNEALRRKLPLIAISVGGKLMELAKKNRAAYIALPDIKTEPRFALGVSLKAILKAMGEQVALREISRLASRLRPADYQAVGRGLAKRLKGKVPVIYASRRNQALAYNWKIKFNETTKIPAFYNVFPELNHNEMTGFSAGGGSAFGGNVHSEIRKLSEKFHFIFLKDAEDSSKILKRMEVTRKLYEDRGLKVETLELINGPAWLKLLSAVVVADWTTYYLAKSYGVEAELVPMVEEFKKLIV